MIWCMLILIYLILIKHRHWLILITPSLAIIHIVLQANIYFNMNKLLSEKQLLFWIITTLVQVKTILGHIIIRETHLSYLGFVLFVLLLAEPLHCFLKIVSLFQPNKICLINNSWNARRCVHIWWRLKLKRNLNGSRLRFLWKVNFLQNSLTKVSGKSLSGRFKGLKSS